MTADLDARLIAALQHDGRATYRELAMRLGIPRATVSQRVQALLESGTVEVVAVAHPELLGLRSLAHVSITVSDATRPVIDAVCASDAAVYVSAVSGDCDVITELRVRDQRELYLAIAGIRRQPGVRSVNTLVYTDVIKSVFMPKGALPAEVRVDATDVRLIELLEPRGRISFVELAKQVGMSPSAVRARVNRLVDSMALRVAAVVRQRAGSGKLAMGIAMNLAAPDHDVIEFLEALSGTEFVARSLGRYDLVGTVAADSSSELHAIAEQLRSLDGVLRLATWTHLEVFKEHYARTIDPGPRPSG